MQNFPFQKWSRMLGYKENDAMISRTIWKLEKIEDFFGSTKAFYNLKYSIKEMFMHNFETGIDI